VHPDYRVHRSRGGGGSPIHRGPNSSVGGMPHRSGARGRLLHLTVVGGGRHENGVRLVTSFNGGDYLLSMTRGSGRGETKVGVALDAVESG
jgi:hypothetical protein